MAGKIELEQNYRDKYSIIVIAGFLILTVAKAAQLIAEGSLLTLETAAISAIAVGLGFLLFTLTQSTLKLKISKKKVSVKVLPMGLFNIQLKKKNIEKIDFMKTSPVASSTGSFVHFGDNDRVFNFGGNKAMVITLRNGKQYSFFSNELFKQREEILNNVFETA